MPAGALPAALRCPAMILSAPVPSVGLPPAQRSCCSVRPHSYVCPTSPNLNCAPAPHNCKHAQVTTPTSCRALCRAAVLPDQPDVCGLDQVQPHHGGPLGYHRHPGSCAAVPHHGAQPLGQAHLPPPVSGPSRPSNALWSLNFTGSGQRYVRLCVAELEAAMLRDAWAGSVLPSCSKHRPFTVG